MHAYKFVLQDHHSESALDNLLIRNQSVGGMGMFYLFIFLSFLPLSLPPEHFAE